MQLHWKLSLPMLGCMLTLKDFSNISEWRISKGFENTAKQNFGGGNTAWEERKLSKYETRWTNALFISQAVVASLLIQTAVAFCYTTFCNFPPVQWDPSGGDSWRTMWQQQLRMQSNGWRTRRPFWNLVVQKVRKFSLDITCQMFFLMSNFMTDVIKVLLSI